MEKEIKIGSTWYNILLTEENSVVVFRNGSFAWKGFWSPLKLELHLQNCPFEMIEEKLSFLLRNEIMQPSLKLKNK